LATLALDGSGEVRQPGRGATAIRYLDLPFLLVALVVFIAADLPMLGYAVVAGVWLVQLAIEIWARRRTQKELDQGNRRGAMGWVAATGLGRVYIVTTAVLLVGLLGSREDGLAAAVLGLVLFTVHFACRFAANAIEGTPAGSTK
jgi:hypothetical protein